MVAPDEAAPRKFRVEGGGHRITLDYFGRSSGRGDGCEAFVIGLHNRTLRAHFHPVDQFQLLLGADGSRYQRSAVPALMLHYADAYSTYGPLEGADPPMRFFTLRAEATDVTAFMPEDRELLLYRGRRNVHFDPFDAAPELPGAGKVEEVALVAEETDGLSARMILAGAGAPVVLPGGTGSNGRYCYVAEGSFGYDGRDYATESLGFIAAGDPPATGIAGQRGVRLLVMSFPSPSSRSSREAGAAS